MSKNTRRKRSQAPRIAMAVAAHVYTRGLPFDQSKFIRRLAAHLKRFGFVWLALAAVMVAGCVESESESRSRVEAVFTNGDIEQLPTANRYGYEWLVKCQDGRIVYVQEDSGKVTSNTIFKAVEK